MKNRTYFRWGVTIFACVAAILVFYNTFFQNGVLLLFLQRLSQILTSVLYGFVLAYLLAPVVNFFDRLLGRRVRKDGGWIRGVSILLTWLLAGLFLYGLFSLLIPGLVDSVTQLVNNMEKYYLEVSAWVQDTVNANPKVSAWATDALSNYYNDMVEWLTNTWIPQAQQALLALTGGVVSVVVFLKDFIVGVSVSVYLLARKEKFGLQMRKLVYAVASEPVYRRTLREVSRIDRVFSRFVRGKLLDSLIIGILCLIFSLILGFPYAPLVSAIVCVTNMIPFFGPIIGAIPCAFLILLVDPLKCLYFVIFIIVLQQFDGNILGPRILGDSLGLSGFWIIVGVLIGGGFFGIVGMFLGTPVLACVYFSVSFFCRRRLAEKGVASNETLYSAPETDAPDAPEKTEAGNAEEKKKKT